MFKTYGYFREINKSKGGVAEDVARKARRNGKFSSQIGDDAEKEV